MSARVSYPLLDGGEMGRDGRCEVCGRTIQVLKDGTLRAHKWHRRIGDLCQGSGYRQARWPVGQLLRHHAGDLWEVVEDLAGTTRYRDYKLRCLAGREKGRAMNAHGEYMHRHGWTAVASTADSTDPAVQPEPTPQASPAQAGATPPSPAQSPA